MHLSERSRANGRGPAAGLSSESTSASGSRLLERRSSSPTPRSGDHTDHRKSASEPVRLRGRGLQECGAGCAGCAGCAGSPHLKHRSLPPLGPAHWSPASRVTHSTERAPGKEAPAPPVTGTLLPPACDPALSTATSASLLSVVSLVSGDQSHSRHHSSDVDSPHRSRRWAAGEHWPLTNCSSHSTAKALSLTAAALPLGPLGGSVASALQPTAAGWPPDALTDYREHGQAVDTLRKVRTARCRDAAALLTVRV